MSFRSSSRRKLRAVLQILGPAISAVWALPGNAAGQSNATWSAGASSNWNVAGNWSGGAIPNNGSPPGARYNVMIDAGQAPAVNVTIPSGAFTVNSVSVSAADQLTLANASTLAVVGNDVSGTISNAGTISVASTGSVTSLNINTASIGLTGSGTVTLASNARIGGNGTFNNVDNLIVGVGAVSLNGLNLVNGGTIAASVGTLTIDPINTSGMTNSGVLSAIMGGTLELTGAAGGNFTNTGTILANAANVRLINATNISGGTLASTGGGVVRCATSHTVNLSNVNFVGDYSIDNAGITAIGGSNANYGTITVASTGGNTALQLTGGATVTLMGGGTVVMSGANSLVIGSGQLVTDNTIRGRGSLGAGQMGLVNAGVVSADIAGAALTVDPINSFGVFNTGVMRAENGATLTLTGTGGGTFVNGAGGTIAALNGSTVELVGSATLTGGTLTSSGGTFSVVGLAASAIRDFVNNGSITLQNGSALSIGGSIINNGSILINSTGGSTLVSNGGGTTTIDGSGSITLTQTLAILGGSGTLLTSNTIRGAGQVGNNNIIIRNSGTIEAATVGPASVLTLDPVNTFAMVNTGTWLAGTGNLTLTGFGGGTFDSTAGSIRVDSTGTITTQSGAVVNAGAVRLDGTWQALSSTLTLGPVDGAGTLNHSSTGTATATHYRVAAISASSGTVSVATNGSNLGTSKLTTLNLTGSSRLDLNDNDLIVTSTPKATIEAAIAQARGTGNWIGSGITSSAARTNLGANTNLGVLGGAEYNLFGNGNGTFSGQSYVPSDTLVKYTWNGDTNFSGTVNFDDYVRVDIGFNTNLTGWGNGDFNYSGVVNFDDYVMIDVAFNTQSGTLSRAVDYISGDDRSNVGLDDPSIAVVIDHFEQFGVAYASAFLAAIPEPTSLALLGVPALAGMLRRRRRG